MRPIYKGKDREVTRWVQTSSPERSPVEQYPVPFSQMETIIINPDGKEIPISCLHYGMPPGAGNRRM